MELYLIRHGETVDNVAGLYAGVRDSALTNHGVEQARRLGEHFAKCGVTFTHIFASPLSRAFKTAQAIHSAQKPSDVKPAEIVKVQNLIEQDFGYYEGKTFQARSDARKTGKESHREKHKDDPGFIDVESKEAMNKRADNFLDEHMMPIFAKEHETTVVAVVSHGILLSHLWRRLLARLPAKSVSVPSEITAIRGNIVLEHLGGWSNTGYLELKLSQAAVRQSMREPNASLDVETEHDVDAATIEMHTEALMPANSSPDPSVPPSKQVMRRWSATIRGIDRKEHLVGLKRQRGGIGRSAHDEGQKKLEGFFKRQRTS